MSVTEVVFETNVRNQAIAQLVALMEREKLVRFVRERRITIPGFSHRVKNVPYPMLKDSVQNFLRKPNNFEVHLTVLRKAFEAILDDQNMSDNDKMLYLKQADGMADAEKLGVFMKMYPDRYFELADLIDQAIQDEIPVVSIIFDQEDISVQDHLNFLIEQKRIDVKDTLELLAPYMEADADTVTNSLEDMLRRPITDGQLLTYYLKHLSDEREKDSVQEYDELIFRAITIDSIIMIQNIIEHNKQLIKEREGWKHKYIVEKNMTKQLQTENEQTNEMLQQNLREKTNEHKEFMKEIHSLSEERRTLKEQLHSKAEKLDLLKKELQTKNKEIEHHRNELDDLKAINERLKQNSYKEQSNFEGDSFVEGKEVAALERQAKENIDMNLIGEQVPILLFTKKKDELYEAYFSKRQLYYFDDVNELEEELEGNDSYDTVFINAEMLTTKQKFQIEKICNALGQEFRMISGAPKQVVRKIITYLDGEILNEIN